MTDALREALAVLPAKLSGHLLLTLAAMGLGGALTAPLVMISLRAASVRSLLLGLASVVQTAPSLALLALMVPLLGLGFKPAFIALSLYSLLPMLRNSITGIEGVDPDAVQAARGCGMTERQILRRIQLPLAAPVIVAGVRTATVWVVGIATLATPVGGTCLGDYIFQGLQLMRYEVVIFGSAVAAALALALDGVIRLAEVAAARRSRRLGLAAILGVAVILGVGLLPALLMRGPGASAIRIGAKTFTEQYILAQLIERRLRAAGVETDLRESLGSVVAFRALTQGEIDVYIDYTGTLWFNVMARRDILAPDQTTARVREWLAAEHGVELLGALGFENAYGFAVRAETAKTLGLRSIEDLARHAPGLSVGGDYEFFGRPDWASVRDAYGLRFKDTRSLDAALMYPALANGDVDVISAFTTDARIEEFDLRVLGDPRRAFPPYDAVALLSPRAASRGDVARALEPILGAIGESRMRAANAKVDLDNESIAAAAAWLDTQIGHAAAPSLDRGDEAP